MKLQEQIKLAEDIIRSCQLSISMLDGRIADLDRERALIDQREAQLRKDAESAPERMEIAQKRLKHLRDLERSSHAFGGLTELEKALNKRDRLKAKLEALEADIEAHKD